MVSVTESQLKQIISEAIAAEFRKRSILNEDQAGDSIKFARNLYMERTGKSKEEADKFVRIDLRASFPPLRDKKIGKFILGVTRMFLDGQLSDATTIANLNSTLKYVGDPTHINEYDRNLNGMSAQDLIDRFAPARMQDMEKDKAELGKTQYTAKNEYKVVRIDSFEQAQQYGKYNDWCLAQPNGKGMFDRYTSEGVNQLYIILRDGFENEPRVAGPNRPYDSYGLSMMTVIVDPYGQMTQSTTRWNHKNGSNDSAFTPKQMSEVIGRNFYEVFKPNTKLKDAVEDALGRLRNGEAATDMFDSVGEEQDGMRFVELMSKMNYLTKDNQFLMAQWVDEARTFCEGFGNIFIDGKGNNFINTKGEIISNTWFNSVDDFHEGFARVYVNGKGWNYINAKGEIISRTWFHRVGDFRDGFARVYVNGKGWNYINAKGEIISKTCFDEAGDFSEGFAHVKVDGKGWNYINTEGEIISKTWFVYAYDFRNGFGCVWVKGKKWNFINTKGKLISKTWFDEVGDFSEGFARVKVDGKGWNYINTEGNFLSKTWFAFANYFDKTGYALIMYKEKCYMIDKNAILYDCDDFRYGKKTPVTLNEEAIKQIVRKVLMESLDNNILKQLM